MWPLPYSLTHSYSWQLSEQGQSYSLLHVYRYYNYMNVAVSHIAKMLVMKWKKGL